MSDELAIAFEGYQEFLGSIKEKVRNAQVKAGLAVNRELILLYWQIGREIWARQKEQGWGAKIIKQLAADLRHSFPEVKGFSERNLQYMRTFAEAYQDEQFTQALPAQITWYHNCTILDKIKDPDERVWYIEQTVQHGWSRDVLVHQIESGLHLRIGRAETNFKKNLLPPQSDLAQQILKDPYNFDFLVLGENMAERDLERGLTDHIREFLLELGAGFSFLGSQYHITVDGKDYYIDLLFYHVKLHCYVAIDLKVSDFEPEYVGKMNFYLSALDDLMRDPERDNPSIGIILCKSKSKVVAEYALRNSTTPIGVSQYQLTQLGDKLKRSLPSIEQLEAELESLPETPIE